MSQYLNKIGLIRYNNNTYQQINQPQYYSVRDPALVSSDPRINFFSYPWKSDSHWSYTNFGQGWFYTGKDEIAYTVDITSGELSCFNPATSTNIKDYFIYNIIPIQQFLLSGISATLQNRNLFADPRQLYFLSSFTNNKLYKVKYHNYYKAVSGHVIQEGSPAVSTFTYEVINDDDSTTPLVLDWSPLNLDINMHSELPPIVTGYWTDTNTPICGMLYVRPKFDQGSINDIYSNELQFNVKSPNITQTTDLDTLCSNYVEGLFTNIPGTDYITGICTTKMLFIDAQQQKDKQYVYMRGLFKGNIDYQQIQGNEIVAPSTVVKKVAVKNLQGTLRNIIDLPDEIKYGLDHYYAWGWLYGIDNIKYTNTWYKNEISGTLKSSNTNYDDREIVKDKYVGSLSTSIITNNGVDDVVNILTGVFYKDENASIITGYMEGIIEPFSIHMKGYLTGYYSMISNDTLKPLQLKGTLYNKSMVGDDLRQILDIKYANTLGRKGLTYPDPLHGQKLNFASKNYDPYNNPYMLQSWKIIEYKLSQDEIDYQREEIHNATDLNTYLVDNKYIQQKYKSRIHRTDEQLSGLLSGINPVGYYYYVYWDRDQEYGDFVIRCSYKRKPTDKSFLTFRTQFDAQKYIKHICGQSNLKLKQYVISEEMINGVNIVTTNYVLDSSDLEIK